ncbi:DUF4191 domain-containing protein [Nocardiopsis composta]|uniref:Putative membrane protein YeaQ/YmgE (Transglycosylase-associated protein family) n=1 Tax=Nocardiopsis composta TaxID=157465 RepID=A0A7W8QTF1_9ACTN|nr:DUF4191 domain-containing protein [Nocardiopsis composta]MBB5435645.1 putative membrane protein YeaQ/YmgE (transglycosylase-associated protein family) [Nocardiopsis composta]
MAKKPKETKTPQATDAAGQKKPGRFKQIGMVAKVVHQQSPKSIPIAVAIFVGIVALSVVGAVLTGGWLYWMSLGIPIGFLAGFIFFTRSAQKIQYKMLDGQLGAGMAVLENMRGDWTVDPGVGATRQMDVVHRVVGRPGIVLVGEGDPNRLRKVIGAEKKRVARVAYNMPIYDVVVGNGEGQVKIADLQKHMMKLPRNLDKTEVAEVRYRLRALPAAVQMPKGPMPKGVKMPKGPKAQGSR